MTRQNAYHPGTNPSQTSSDLANLKQAIQLLLKVMRQSGVGGLPLLALPSLQGTDATMSVGETLSLDAANTGTGGITSIQVPSEEKLLEDTTNWIQVRDRSEVRRAQLWWQTCWLRRGDFVERGSRVRSILTSTHSIHY